MRLRYENTMDDLLAFQQYHSAHSPAMKRVFAGYRWGSALIVFVLVCLTPSRHGTNIVGASVGAAVMALICPFLWRRGMKRQVLKMYAEGNNRGYLGAHELEITEDGIIERSTYNESRTAWGAVDRIESTPDHTFIYLSSLAAHVIPHNRILEGEYTAFLAELGQRFQPDRRLPQPDRQ